MSKKSFILSSAGLKNLIQNQNYGEEFKFIFGEHEIKMKNIFAEFISPYVSQIHQSDPTIDSISFPSTNSSKNRTYLNYLQKITDNVISLFELISKGNSIEIDKSQCIQMQIISILLKNGELFRKLDSLFPAENDENKINEEIEFISFLESNLESQEIINQSKAIEYIASNFYSIDPNKIIDLPKNVFYSILKSKKLTIESEDSLLDLIDQFFNNKENQEQNEKEFKNDHFLSKTDFYEEVDFDFLSENKFKEFIESFKSSEMTESLWNKFKKCFYVYKKSSSSSQKDDGCRGHNYAIKGRQIEYDGNKEHAFNGIIHELTKEAGGNVDDKGFVKVTASSINGSYHPKNAVDLDNSDNFFHSYDVENTWLQYEFLKRKVIPTHYSIRSWGRSGKGGHHPKNWVIEGSNDSVNWKNLDSQQNVEFLNDSKAFHTFDIKNVLESKEGFRYLRMRCTGLNCCGANYMILSAVEYFGNLIEE